MSPYFLINLLTLPCACEHKVSVNNVSDALIQATKNAPANRNLRSAAAGSRPK